MRQQLRASTRKRYLSSESRKAYKVRKNLDGSLETSPMLPGVCSRCTSPLARIVEGFKQLRHQGTELKKRKRSLPCPKVPNRDHYRNVRMQNEWIRGNLFDSMGNYLFCHQCIVRALSVSPQRLSRQRKVKRSMLQRPVVQMTKSSVEEEKLKPFVVMPDTVESAFGQWWECIPSEHLVDVRYPHEKHGLSGQISNNAKSDIKEDFLDFVDKNSQPNGRRLDSRNPTHYFL